MPVGGSVDEGVLILLVARRYVREAASARCLYEAVERRRGAALARLCPARRVRCWHEAACCRVHPKWHRFVQVSEPAPGLRIRKCTPGHSRRRSGARWIQADRL